MTSRTSAPVYYTRRARIYLKELWDRREFAWFLALGNFKSRNASTALGLFWWVLNPLLLSLVYWLVFGLIFPGARDLTYLMAGMFVFHFTSHSMMGGANAILQNSRLLANQRFPRILLPIANIMESTFGFLVSLLLLLVLAVPISGNLPGTGIILLALLIPLQFLFNIGLGAITARLAVPFRDITNFLPYFTRVWLYLSPIIWPLAFLETERAASFAPFVELNPMFSIIGVYRYALLGHPFDPTQLIVFAVWSLTTAVVGIGLFVKYEGRIVRYL